MGLAGFIIGTVIAQLAGAWTYRRAKSKLALSGLGAAVASGLATMVAGTLVYASLRVHEWVAGPDASWLVSLFLASCMGIVQGALFRGRPLEPRA